MDVSFYDEFVLNWCRARRGVAGWKGVNVLEGIEDIVMDS